MPEAENQKKPRRWKGKLVQRIRPQIVRPKGLAITDDATLAEANEEMTNLYLAAIEREYAEKLNLLMQHYGLPNGDFQNLAIQLAIELGIPGFQVDPSLFELSEDFHGFVDPGDKQGRPAEWTSERLDDLIVAVTNARKLPGISTDDEALRYIAQSEKWARPDDRDLGQWIKTLKNELARARGIQRDVNRLQERLEEIKLDNPEN